MIRSVFRGLVGLLTLWILGFAGFVCWVAVLSRSREPVNPAVVFTGESIRVQRAFELMAEGAIGELFVSGVARGSSWEVIQERYPITYALEPDQVRLGFTARDTIGNAVETVEWLQEYYPQGGDCLLITSDYHLPRSLLELERHAEGRWRFQPYAVSSADHTWSRRLRLLLSEYHKSAVDWLLGGWSHGWARLGRRHHVSSQAPASRSGCS
jgi:uncharacterized SAM-binding protein YcdF (DUF218 family)